MKEKDLKQKLCQSFYFDIWKELLPLFFRKIEICVRFFMITILLLQPRTLTLQ